MTKKELNQVKQLEEDLNEAKRLKWMLDQGSISITTRKSKHSLIVLKSAAYYDAIHKIISDHLSKLEKEFKNLQINYCENCQGTGIDPSYGFGIYSSCPKCQA